MRKLVVLISGIIVMVIAALLLWPGSGGGLVVYSALDYGPAVAKAFTAETGIPVKTIRLPTGGLLARVTAEGHHPDWDLAWFDGATAAVLLDRAGLLAHGLTPPADLSAIGRTMTSPDGAYVPTGLTLAGVFIAPNPSTVPMPRDWADLTKPAYFGMIGMNDPSISGPTYPALAGMIKSAGGWPDGKTYIEALKANGLHVFAKNDATLAALRSGAIKLAIVQSSAAINTAANIDRHLRVVFPKPAYELPNVIVMAKGLTGKRRAEALRFIAFVNAPETQAIRMKDGAGDGYYWPVTTTPASRKALPALDTLDLGTLNAERWGRVQNTITAWFARRVTGAGT
ncbi:MAG: extracellular solute-binding protein [Acidiphilium sp.]|nr:extracellular solute-binding protein [Acidiphilium sp.]MDD4936727.1 extracellular solute-binding protein [Acidiphilium sp.]